MGTGGRDTDRIRAVAREYKMGKLLRRRFGDRIEELKDRGEYGSEPNGDFTYAELREIAEEVLRGDL